MHVGDPHARREALQRREEQRRHRQAGERRAAGAAAPLPAQAVLRHVAVLGVRAFAEAYCAPVEGNFIVRFASHPYTSLSTSVYRFCTSQVR